MPTRMQPPVARSAIGAPSRFAAVAVGSVVGVGLGWWCRAFAGSNSISGVLANLGAPWVVAAFVTGAISIGHGQRAGSTRSAVGAALAGALGGAACLVVATLVYYGPARTGSFDFHGAAARTAFWTTASVAVGLVFGAAGSLWRASPCGWVRAGCLVVLGTVIAGEAGFLTVAGATEYDAFTRDVLGAVGRAVRAHV